MKDMTLRPQFVEFMPEKLEQGVLYVSERFETAIHLCACGSCGEKTVTPFGIGDRGWLYTRNAQEEVTLHPSIGNFAMPCRSHYWVQGNRVVWC
ncbi:DUF6527 family protein [Paraburkholderia fungorum]|uniref:DUF6527 family protein n=1 Tax=Paraburkholderia fungorum TaxID=134537 RepID=UPI0038B89884